MTFFNKNMLMAFVMLFGVFILHMSFALVLNSYLVPALLPVVTDDSIGVTVDAATQASVVSGFDFILRMLNLMPYVIYFTIIIYMVVLSIRKEPDSQYGGQY